MGDNIPQEVINAIHCFVNDDVMHMWSRRRGIRSTCEYCGTPERAVGEGEVCYVKLNRMLIEFAEFVYLKGREDKG